jgi:hypothetical protein
MNKAQALPAVTLTIRWQDLLPASTTAALRRQRWAHWLRLSRTAGHTGTARFWATPDAPCNTCSHRRGSWCSAQGLPCNVNPITTPRHGLQGLACTGAGYTARALQQIPLFVTSGTTLEVTA